MLRGGESLTMVVGGVCTCIYVVRVFCDLATHLILIEPPIFSLHAEHGCKVFGLSYSAVKAFPYAAGLLVVCLWRV